MAFVINLGFYLSPITLNVLVFSVLTVWVISFFLFGKQYTETAVSYYFFYCFLALIVYFYQRTFLPGSEGFTVTSALHYLYGHVMLDDLFFYKGAIDAYGGNLHAFSRFLKIVPFLTRTEEPHLINFLYFNCIPLAFLPILVYRIAQLVTEDEKTARVAKLLMLFCPFTLASGTILMRDSWIEAGVAFVFFGFLQRHYLFSIVNFALVAFLRVTALPILVLASAYGTILGSAFQKYKISKKTFLRIIFAAFIVLFGVFLSWSYLEQDLARTGLGENLLLRERFVERIQRRHNTSGGLFLRVYSLPTILRVPLGGIIYFLMPFPVISRMLGPYVTGYSVFTFIYSVLLIFWIGYFVKATIRIIVSNNKKLKQVLQFFLASLLLLSFYSLQVRHKTMIQPFFYILVAHGITNQRSKSFQIFVSALYGMAAFFYQAFLR